MSEVATLSQIQVVPDHPKDAKVARLASQMLTHYALGEEGMKAYRREYLKAEADRLGFKLVQEE